MIQKKYKMGYYGIIIILLLIIGSFFLKKVRASSLKENNINYVDITIYNPTRPSFSIETKCDWNNTTRKFDFYRKLYLSGKSQIRLIVPKQFKKCEIWPKLEKLF